MLLYSITSLGEEIHIQTGSNGKLHLKHCHIHNALINKGQIHFGADYSFVDYAFVCFLMWAFKVLDMALSKVIPILQCVRRHKDE